MILNIEKSGFFDSANTIATKQNNPIKKDGTSNFLDDIVSKEKQRPPIYNPEDYAIMLKKWGKKSSNGGLMSLYSSSSTSDLESSRSQGNSFRDYRNPMLASAGSEMTLRQFGTVSELLAKLKSDMKLAFPSFVQEFVADPLDGVTLLLDLLRAIQVGQSNTVIHGPPGASSTVGKIPPSLQRRALLDELSCLQCLLNCCVRYTESLRKLIASSAGLFTVAVCIMSNVNKSRIIALQLLTKACDPGIGGHSAVSEAMSTLRLRFGEPVRFRFLVGMLTSTGGQKELIASGLNFLNKFLDTAASPQKRLYIQAELDQAGFDIDVIKNNISSYHGTEVILEEIRYWEKRTINIENLNLRLECCKKENTHLKERIDKLERKIKILQDEKGLLTCVEKNLKDRCHELQSEIRSLRSSQGSYTKKIQDAAPNDDEGISSSERSLTPEDEVHRELMFDNYSIHNSTDQKGPPFTGQDDDEETTIDEVIEELKNIINDAQSQDIAKIEQHKLEKEQQRIEEAQVASKLQIHIDADDYAVASESEIIPTDLHPQPPRRAKSLVHLFVPSEDYYYCPKELFFENETPYTSTEGSDSLLSSAKGAVARVKTPDTLPVGSVKCKKTVEVKTDTKQPNSFKYGDAFYYSTTVNVCQTQNNENNISHKVKAKSLDRIDKGLDSIVDIVLTNNTFDQKIQMSSRSDCSKPPSLTKSVSNVYIKSSVRQRLRSYSDDKQKMFLPLAADVSYYFPRTPEKTSSNGSFLVKRGHGNAGMYSGQVQNNGCKVVRSKEFLSISSGKTGEKVTDLPSGLY
ncbi:multiple wing hairs isoform X2 [Rhynchophorus ferrugineus]|uniref:multiple wing hairs isoform X2 n=1 Tax=Rhynchophorus ferrugineus TaxID=354439 RepID=UPI003FCEB443